MSRRGQAIKNTEILKAIETLQSNLDISLAPIATMKTDIAKIKQDIQSLQSSNNKVNMFMQKNSNKIARQYTFIEDEIVAVKENSFILKDDFEEFSQSMAEKMDQMNSTSNSLSTWNEQLFQKIKDII